MGDTVSKSNMTPVPAGWSCHPPVSSTSQNRSFDLAQKLSKAICFPLEFNHPGTPIVLNHNHVSKWVTLYPTRSPQQLALNPAVTRRGWGVGNRIKNEGNDMLGSQSSVAMTACDFRADLLITNNNNGRLWTGERHHHYSVTTEANHRCLRCYQ